MSLDPDRARLAILEVWKGSAGREVTVEFTSGMICPAPDRYEVGETVLAFLVTGQTRLESLRSRARSDELDRLEPRWQGKWFAVGLSYGTLYPSPGMSRPATIRSG